MSNVRSGRLTRHVTRKTRAWHAVPIAYSMAPALCGSDLDQLCGMVLMLVSKFAVRIYWHLRATAVPSLDLD